MSCHERHDLGGRVAWTERTPLFVAGEGEKGSRQRILPPVPVVRLPRVDELGVWPIFRGG